MKVIKNILIVLVVAAFHCSCIKQVDVPLRNEDPILVVEGNITTDTVPYTVKLTYSGPLTLATEIPENYLEENAVVNISDDQGNTTSLAYTGSQGIYQTTDPAYIGQAGRSYHVTIVLPGGKKFISKPEKIPPPVSISNVSVEFKSDFDFTHPSYLAVYADIDDPIGEENYYKWNFYSYIMRQTHGIPCGFGCIMYEYCFQRITDNKTRIYSDQAINGNKISHQLMGYSYIYAFGKHYVDVSQLSLTREAYQFWQRYNEQQTRTGSILDPLPASIKGNVYNESNADEFALGYFSASSLTRNRIVLVPFGITRYLLDISAVSFIPDKSIACFDYYPNTLSYPPPPADQYPPPPGWENAERKEINFKYP